LRGAQEVVERDALVGGWWKSYAVEEWPLRKVRCSVEPSLWHRLERPNLRYRFYRIDSPFSSHVTMVSVAGEDDEGWVFSVGSACRETRAASWKKSLLEAIQGRHCVRKLQQQEPQTPVPTTFFQHALYYARQPELLATTILEQSQQFKGDADQHTHESLTDLQAKLGPLRPILFRNITPPILPDESPPWIVLRVLIPGLQPLHGDHRLPFLGGPLWNARLLAVWAAMPPHPFA
jgi:ribosomal protein S12 methylthiotransferase accessory factor